MSALRLVMTTAGMARFTAAQLGQPVDLTVARVGLTAQAFVAAPSLTALPGEHRRVAMISGAAVGSNVAHLVLRDDGAVAYTVRGFGLFFADGTLFATYCNPVPIVEKSALVTLLMPIDLAFPDATIDKLTFGDANFLNPPATETTAGIARLATLAEAQAGAPRAVTTGAVVKAMVDATAAAWRAAVDALAAATGQAMDGLATRRVDGSGLVKGGGRNDQNVTLTVDAATSAEVKAGTATDKAITPAALRGAYATDFAGGVRVHPDGFVEMWGVAATRSTEGAFSLVFPRPFPTACAGVVGMTRNLNQTVDGHTSIEEVALYPDRADLFVQNHQTAANETGGFRWFAWGY